MIDSLKIAILLFGNFTALDVVGPYEVLSRVPNAKIYLVARERPLYKDDKGLRLSADYLLGEIVNPDILVVPGGFGIDSILEDQEILRWILVAHTTTKWTTSVCSGALLLGSAGLLKGRIATTHWNRKDQLVN